MKSNLIVITVGPGVITTTAYNYLELTIVVQVGLLLQSSSMKYVCQYN